eukprot:m.436310 g.436310  ORF g.436310 m.436310 type:complete len:360 (-) comp17960_c0_seq1:1709-2788(-)
MGQFNDLSKGTFIYLFIVALVIAPPRPFVELGWTVEGVFSGFVGREHDHFVHHHIRRSYATVITHACLLLGYLGLVYVYIGERAFLPPGDDTALAVIKVFVWWIALGCGLMAVAMAEIWRLNGWRRHPIVQRLEKYPGGWRAASDSISTDFRRMDKIYVKLGFQAVLVTDRWIVRVGMYGLDIASQRDVDISIAGTQTVASLEDADDAGQILTLKVTSLNQSPFTIRLSAVHYHDIDERVLRPIRNLRGVVIARSLEEEFLEVLERHVKAADPYMLPRGEELDRCVGCMSSPADIKVSVCRCRPMWCLACLAKWFANNQPQDQPEVWMEGQGECPTCRSKFNVNDLAEAVETPRYDAPL